MSDPSATPVPEEHPVAGDEQRSDDERVDEELEETFPASDPPSTY
jgi:hypothetical protein